MGRNRHEIEVGRADVMQPCPQWRRPWRRMPLRTAMLIYVPIHP